MKSIFHHFWRALVEVNKKKFLEREILTLNVKNGSFFVFSADKSKQLVTFWENN